jgi:hypothetical protein
MARYLMQCIKYLCSELLLKGKRIYLSSNFHFLWTHPAPHFGITISLICKVVHIIFSAKIIVFKESVVGK